MTRLIREFKMQHKTDYAMVFVDLVTQVKDFVTLGFKGGSNLSTAVELAVNKLNAIAKKEGVCFVCIAQMNRDADSAKISDISEIPNLRPTLNNVKNSHALGERARVAIALFRPKYYADRLFPDHEAVQFMPDQLEAQVVKQSMGRVGIRGLYLFNGPMFKLTPIAQEEEPVAS
jgi:replicative DNA helicase